MQSFPLSPKRANFAYRGRAGTRALPYILHAVATAARRDPTYASLAWCSHAWHAVENVAHLALRASGLTQRELAQAIGVSLRTVAGWLGGAAIPGPAETLLREIASGAPSATLRARLGTARDREET